MKLRNKKTGEVKKMWKDNICLSFSDCNKVYYSLTELNAEWCDAEDDDLAREWEDYAPTEPLIKDEKIRKAVRTWVEAENCTREMNLYYTLNRQEKYITFHNPQTGSELQLCDFDSPVFQEMREYTIAELCGEEEE